ncbi:SRPBCC family protein [Knoellia subterranea]|uniref:Cyclase n=1 Tax=Knoellia subterranea KCTC 19937 TaxID=1385521 RepID=A0A0A0JK34_9MICO|nr:SRPBCC family protein [Knoellia subterranea]KGN37790.1 hypothetical protein N803_12080 [Knoellia subterranea KCTC 19937]
MATFSATKTSEATVEHPSDLVWDVLTDPTAIARLTPMVRSITTSTGPDGDLWHWQLAKIDVLGKSFELGFTELMTYDPKTRITFRHSPVGTEHAGTDGPYDLLDVGTDSTHLRIELTVTVDLPFPRLARPAVEASMHGVLAAMGAGFGRSIEKELRARAARRR